MAERATVAYLAFCGCSLGAEQLLLFSGRANVPHLSLPPSLSADSHPAVPLRLPKGRFGAGGQEAPRRPVGSPQRQTESHQEQILTQVRTRWCRGQSADLLRALTLRIDLFQGVF